MNLILPPDLEQELSKRAIRLHTSVEEIARAAIAWYLELDQDLLDEIEAWQGVRDEALDLVEKDQP